VWKPTPEELEKNQLDFVNYIMYAVHKQISTKVSRVLDGMVGSSIPGRSVILSSHGDNQSWAAFWGSHI